MLIDQVITETLGECGLHGQPKGVALCYCNRLRPARA